MADLQRIEHDVQEVLHLARDTKQEIKDLHHLCSRFEQEIAAVRHDTLHAIEIVHRLTEIHQETQDHVKRALEIVADIHPHVHRIPELQHAAADLRAELHDVKSATTEAHRQLKEYIDKMNPPEELPKW